MKIIISQDQKYIFNIQNISRIFIKEDYDKCYILADANNRDTYILGDYPDANKAVLVFATLMNFMSSDGESYTIPPAKDVGRFVKITQKK